MKSHWVRMGPKCIDWCLYKKSTPRDIQKTDRRKKTVETEIGLMHLQTKEQKGLSGAFISLGEARKDSFLEPSKVAWPCWHLDIELVLVATRTVREHASFILAH